MSGGTLRVAPEAAARLVRVLREGAARLGSVGPTDPTGLGEGAAAAELAHHAHLARHHVLARLEAARTGLDRCGDGVTALARGAAEADDLLAARLTRLARGSA